MGYAGDHVSQCGYLEPGEFPGDHSLLWADISYASALGHHPPNPQTFEARRLKLGDKRVEDRYLKNYRVKVEYHKLRQRQFRLERTVIPGVALTGRQQQEAEAIDALKTKFMLQAEKKCRKIRAGQVEYSLKLGLEVK